MEQWNQDAGELIQQKGETCEYLLFDRSEDIKEERREAIQTVKTDNKEAKKNIKLRTGKADVRKIKKKGR